MGAVDGAVLCDNGTRLKAGVGAGRNEALNSYDRERTSWVGYQGHQGREEGIMFLKWRTVVTMS